MNKPMESKENKALIAFRSGLNCSQAVVTAYSEELGFDQNMASAISTGFGGGMGRLQATCGAVTGSFMVLGMVNSKKFADNNARKEETYSMIRKFNDKFKTIHGATDCKTLLKCDLNTEEGQRLVKEKNLHDTVCEKCILTSVKLIDVLTGF